MKPELIRLRASSEQHFGNALLRNDSTKRATPDFPATEPDDRVNGMAVRAVHIAEVNPEKRHSPFVMQQKVPLPVENQWIGGTFCGIMFLQ